MVGSGLRLQTLCVSPTSTLRIAPLDSLRLTFELLKPLFQEDTNRIFSAEQIEVHPDLPGILKEYSKVGMFGWCHHVP